jgi:hypothetical protein
MAGTIQADFEGASLSPDATRVELRLGDGQVVSIPHAQLQDAALALMALIQPERVVAGQAAAVTAFNISWWQLRPAPGGAATATFDVGPAQISVLLEAPVLRDLAVGASGMVAAAGG